MRNIPILTRAILIIMVTVMLCMLPAVAVGQDMHLFNVRLSNTFEKVSHDRYNWTVFVVASKSVLDNIQYVEYTLHPTFPNPVRRTTNRNQNFALSTSGWGEFDILAKIVFRDNQIVFLEHRLKLTPSYDRYSEINTGNTARYLRSGGAEWQAFIAAETNTLNEIQYVEYILHPTFTNPVRRIFSRKNGFLLSSSGWGTFTIRINVVFKDGSTRYLEHMLRFPD